MVTLFVDFLRDDIYDEDGVLEQEAPKIYEHGGILATVRPRVEDFLAQYNEAFPAKAMALVLFDDALRHLVRISRILGMPRGNALLVGVGGSGRQSLTRLATFLSDFKCYSLEITRGHVLIREAWWWPPVAAGHRSHDGTPLIHTIAICLFT